MTDPDESRSGGPATPPPADPASPATEPGSQAPVNDPAATPPPHEAPAAAPGAAAPDPTPESPTTTESTPEPPASAPAPTSPFTATVEPAPAPQPAPPAPAPPPAPVPMAAPPAAPATSSLSPTEAEAEAGAGADDDFDDWEDDFDDYRGPRWIGLVTTVGAGIVGVVTLQVLMVLVEGLSLKNGQRFGVPDSLIHRIGYPFGGLGSTAMLLLLLATILLALPAILDEDVTDGQYSVGGAALRTAVVLAVLVALGSILAVLSGFHPYSAENRSVPGYVRVQYTSFLLATIGSAALAGVSALAVLRLRDDG